MYLVSQEVGGQGISKNPILAVMFDYDNTLRLTESVALGHACTLLNTALTQKGVPAKSLYDEEGFKREFVGTTFREIVKRAGEAKGVEFSEEELDQLAVEERTKVIPHLVEHSETMPSAIVALDGLRAMSVTSVVVSSSHPDRLRACMEKAGQVQYISEVFSVQDPKSPTEPKPAPYIYLNAARALSLEPGQCLAVEDSPTGVRSAATAGIPTIGFVGPYPHDQREAMRTKLHGAGARWVIDNLARIPTMVTLLNTKGAEGFAELDMIYGAERS